MPFKAFVSSTYEDLKLHRSHVIDALAKAGIFVDPMERWSAAAEEPRTFSQERVKGCHLCVLLVGFRRGTVPKGSEFSITQLEYRAAVDWGIDVLVFLLEEDAPWPRKFDELDKDPEIRRWREDLQERHGVAFFGFQPNSIEVAPALTRWTATASKRLTGKGDMILGRWEHCLSVDGAEFEYVSRFVVSKSDGEYFMSVLDQRGAPEIDPAIALSDVKCDGTVWSFKPNWGDGRVGTVELRRITNDLFAGDTRFQGEFLQFDRFKRVPEGNR